MLSDEGSNSVQRQPQRLKALAQKLPDAVFITNLAQKPSAHLGVFAKILQNILSAKDIQINISLDENGEPIL